MTKIKLKNERSKEPPSTKFLGRFSKDGGLSFGQYTRMHLKKFIKENPNLPFELRPLLPESSKQRGFFEGAIVPLITFYQEGMDYKNSQHLVAVREWLKIEFNGEMIQIGGKVHKVAKSTKNALNQGFLERVMDWLVENYAPPVEVIDPKHYKHWKDAIFPYKGADNYIDYLRSLNLIK